MRQQIAVCCYQLQHTVKVVNVHPVAHVWHGVQSYVIIALLQMLKSVYVLTCPHFSVFTYQQKQYEIRAKRKKEIISNHPSIPTKLAYLP